MKTKLRPTIAALAVSACFPAQAQNANAELLKELQALKAKVAEL